MAGERNSGWPGFFRVFAVFAALMLLLAQSGQELVPISSGDWQVLSIYEGTHPLVGPRPVHGVGDVRPGGGKQVRPGRDPAAPGPPRLLHVGVLGGSVRCGVPSAGGRGPHLGGRLVRPGVGGPGEYLFPPVDSISPHRPVSGPTPCSSGSPRRPAGGRFCTSWAWLSSLPACCPCGPPSTPIRCSPSCWSGFRSTWCWAIWATTWPGGI